MFALLLPTLWVVATPAFAQCTNSAIPGRSYEYYIVAQTGSCNGNNFTSLGSNPAINDFAQVGFMAQTSALPGNAIFVGDGHNNPATTPINPGEIGSSEIYDGAVQIGSAYPGAASLVSKDSITTTSPATTSIRVWNVDTPDSYRYAARGGPSQQFGAVFPYPSVNKNGDVAFTALDQNNPTIKYLVEVLADGTLYKKPVTVSVGEPMIDDNDDVLLYSTATNSHGNFELVLYGRGLSGPTTIADGYTFSSIDSAPGISRDGNVIAFQATMLSYLGVSGTYGGTGIYMEVKTSTGWQLYQATGVQVYGKTFCQLPSTACQPGAELGFDASGNAIYFNPSGYGVGTRVAVTNLGLGATGINNDTFVISFIGTPTEASRPNPVLNNGTPLFFSGQQGLWTIRVDMEAELGAGYQTMYSPHARTAIPVVQIGDRIGANTVASIGAYDDVANAAEDESGDVRTMRRGDHRVAFWASTSSGGQMIVRANHLDSDQDGLLDHWETTGIDMDQDGVVDLDLAAMGANVNARDLFLQIDWIAQQPGFPYSFEPAPGVISPAPGQGAMSFLQEMFANAPELSGNEYGVRIDHGTPAAISKGIALHIDGGKGTDKSGGAYAVNMGTGPIAGGNQIGLTGTGSTGFPEVMYFGKPNSVTVPGIGARAFQDVKDNYFGHQDKDGREFAFHYAVFADHFAVRSDSSNANNWQVLSAGANVLTSASPLPASAAPGDVVKITAGTGKGEYGSVDDILNSTTLQIGANWTTAPDHTSTFSILQGNLGIAEVFFWPDPDANSLPGNDLMLDMGPYAWAPDNTPNELLGTPCGQWRTLAHELGHTLGLRHGGNNISNPYMGSSYLSIMSYSYSLQCNPISAVQSYSTTGDPTFDDWANLQHNFSDSEIHMGSSVGNSFGTYPEDDLETPEQTVIDYVNTNGPIDGTPPTVAITSPAANGNVGLTLPLQVKVNATDNVAVASVSVSFDVSGSGTNDLITAKGTGPAYTASLPALSGPKGTRTLTASAIDTSGNTATTSISVNVESPNPVPALASLVPPNATHGGPAFTLTVKGSNFVSGCTVEWNGKGVATTFVNGGQVTATISKADIATAGSATVAVKNPAPGGGTSNTLTFTIR
ncbi:MAG: Ig-like domain-containing protein [Bryobacteraceae bacterium]